MTQLFKLTLAAAAVGLLGTTAFAGSRSNCCRPCWCRPAAVTAPATAAAPAPGVVQSYSYEPGTTGDVYVVPAPTRGVSQDRTPYQPYRADNKIRGRYGR
jgi:hypothetical protein